MSQAVSIRFTRVRRLYDGQAALDDVSLTAPAGKVMALLGPSGSGKSTILRLVAGLEPVDAGDIRFGEEVVSSTKATLPPEARRVGMVFQDYALFPHLSAGANVAFGLAHQGRATRDSEARAWLDRVGLGKRLDAFPHELSGGEQQRVALARALAPRPRAILLDEPFSGLDPSLRSELRETTLDALAEAGATAFFVTHDAEEALQVADRLAILRAGRVLQEAAPREAYDKPASVEAAAALGPVNVFEGRVSNGLVATPFGAVDARHLPQGVNARVAVRAEAVKLQPGFGARILDRRPHGANDLVRIDSLGVVWRALIASDLAHGETAEIAIDPRGAFVFEA